MTREHQERSVGREDESASRERRVDDPDEEAGDTRELSVSRSEWWAAVFWLFLGMFTLGIVLLYAGIEVELLVPGVVLVAYGLFVLWNPDLAQTDAPWTGLFWLALGVVTLVVVQAIEFYWAYHLTGIIVGLFLIFAGILVLLDI